MSGTLYLDNSNVVELVGLKNSVTGAADVGASVSLVLLDANGEEVAGETWPVSLSHGEGGTYRATLSPDVEVKDSHIYTARISATGSGGEVGRWNCIVTAAVRACS